MSAILWLAPSGERLRRKGRRGVIYRQNCVIQATMPEHFEISSSSSSSFNSLIQVNNTMQIMQRVK